MVIYKIWFRFQRYYGYNLVFASTIKILGLRGIVLFSIEKKEPKKVDKKITPFRIRNSLIKIFLQYLESPSLHSNLVKSFLTSINFDSLSRKIKNPCLVINKKFFNGGD